MKYSEKLLDPRWQKLRLEVFERDGWCCQGCFDAQNTLHIHHLRYVPGWEPWDYPPEKLITLCETCHSEEREGMPDAIAFLIEQIQDQRFLSNDIREIAQGFNQLRQMHPTGVTATLISYALGNGLAFHKITELYFAHLNEKQKMGDIDGSSRTA